MEQTVIAVTSDHGEEIFERGAFDHGDTLYEEVTHVPLVLHARGRVPGGKRVPGAVSLIDLPATLLDLCLAQDALGQGKSLRPLWEGSEEPGQRVAFAHALDLESRPLRAAWQGRMKYLRRGEGDTALEELYDLALDRGERRNLAAARPETLARLRQLLAEHDARAIEIQAALGEGSEELDEETIRRLKSLGYAGQ